MFWPNWTFSDVYGESIDKSVTVEHSFEAELLINISDSRILTQITDYMSHLILAAPY
jgi:hypothetical protein